MRIKLISFGLEDQTPSQRLGQFGGGEGIEPSVARQQDHLKPESNRILTRNPLGERVWDRTTWHWIKSPAEAQPPLAYPSLYLCSNSPSVI